MNASTLFSLQHQIFVCSKEGNKRTRLTASHVVDCWSNFCILANFEWVSYSEHSGEIKTRFFTIWIRFGSAGFNKAMSLQRSSPLSAGKATIINTAKHTEAETDMHLGAPGVCSNPLPSRMRGESALLELSFLFVLWKVLYFKYCS